MWFYVLLQLCFVFGNASNIGRRVTVPNCGKSASIIHGRILGGLPVREGFLPWMVTLHEKDDSKFRHVCGGSILNERWILTAAHCINRLKTPDHYELYVGLHRLSKKAAGRVKKHGISKFIRHEHHNIHHDNDIALIKTSEPIDFGGSEGFVNGICLPAMNEPLPSSVAMVAGWGHTKNYGVTSDVLRTVHVPIIPRKNCSESYFSFHVLWENTITENMFCAGSAGIDSCQADSGGPLFMWKYGRAYLFGIVSFGNECGLEGYPGVYTKVSSYIDWIEDKIYFD